MSNQDAYGSGPAGDDEYGAAPGQVPGRHDPEPEPGRHGGYAAAPDPGQGYAPGPGQPQGHDAGYGPSGPYGQQGPYGYEPGYAPGYDAGQGYGSGGQPAAPYVPEPSSGQPPTVGDPGAAFAPPSAGDSWTPAGHAPATDAGAYGGPVAGDGWGQAPAGARPWEAAPAGTWEHAGAGGYAYGGAPAPEQGWDVQPHGYPSQGHLEPHAYAQPQPYPPGAAGAEHTAVLPVAEPQPSAGPGGQTPRFAGPGAQTPQTAGFAAAQAPPAPVRTGSPIVPPGIRPAALTAALGLLMAGGAAVGKPGLAVFLVVLQAVTAAGWFRLNGMWPARQGIVLAFAAGVTADAAVLAVNGDHGPFALAGTLGGWMVLVLVLQLRHHGSADERLSSLTATSVSTLLTVLAAGCLATATSHAGTDAVVVGTIAVAAATVLRALPLPGGEPVSVLVALAAAAATGLATGPATGFGGGHSVLLAAAAGACALIGLRVASYDFPSRFVHFTAGVALPLTAAAPVVYALGRVLA